MGFPDSHINTMIYFAANEWLFGGRRRRLLASIAFDEERISQSRPHQGKVMILTMAGFCVNKKA